MMFVSGFETLEEVCEKHIIANGHGCVDCDCDCNCDSGGDTGGECDPCDCNEPG